METRDRNKGKTKDEKEEKEENLDQREDAIRQWIEEDQDGNPGLATLALIYRYTLALKPSLNPKPYYNDTRNLSS